MWAEKKGNETHLVWWLCVGGEYLYMDIIVCQLKPTITYLCIFLLVTQMNPDGTYRLTESDIPS